jgi:23S rRNA (uracil1939-C5)-methyltransferase
VVLLPGGLPGDRWRIRVAGTSSGVARGVGLERLVDGPSRRVSPCVVSDRCGGCSYQELQYEAQLALKTAILRESLARAGAAWAGDIEVVSSPERGWRSRATLHAAMGPSGLALGLHGPRSHEVVEFDECLQLEPRLNRVVGALRAALGREPGVARRLQSVDLASSDDGTEVVAALLGSFDPAKVGSLASLARALPDLTGLGFLSGRGPAGRYVAVSGRPYVHGQVLGRRLRAHVRSFFQANRFLREGLAAQVVDFVPAGGAVLDLYSGVGLFALSLAARAEQVVGLESNEGAVADAVENARGTAHVRFVKGEVGGALTAMPRGHEDEHVVLDPPRTGAGEGVVKAIADRRPRTIVYVSCDPPTLGRDLALLARAGYRPDVLRAFDMFPDTFHVETVVRLVPA